MKLWTASVLLVLAAGCARPQRFSAPAPATALACAVEEAERIGYARLEGRPEAGVVRMGRHVPLPPAVDPTPPEFQLRDVPGQHLVEGEFETQIRITHSRGQLHVQVAAERPRGDIEAEAPQAARDARQIIVLCAPVPAAD